MKGEEKIRTAFDRATRAMRLRDSIGRGTATTRVTMTEGFTVDMSEKGGGDGRGPDPGVMGRTALGTCLAIAYRQWLIQCEVPLERLEVEIQADYDARGEYGVTDGSPAYEEIRYVVTVESDAPEEQIIHGLDEAEKHCTYLVIFREPQRVVRDVRIATPAGSEE